MRDLIYREDAIEALNECTDIKGFAYTSLHDAIMEIPTASESEEQNETRQQNLRHP